MATVKHGTAVSYEISLLFCTLTCSSSVAFSPFRRSSSGASRPRHVALPPHCACRSIDKKIRDCSAHRIPATSRSEDERRAHLLCRSLALLRRSLAFAAMSRRCCAVLRRPHFLSPARPRVLSSGLPVRKIVKLSTGAAYRSDEP